MISNHRHQIRPMVKLNNHQLKAGGCLVSEGTATYLAGYVRPRSCSFSCPSSLIGNEADPTKRRSRRMNPF